MFIADQQKKVMKFLPSIRKCYILKFKEPVAKEPVY